MTGQPSNERDATWQTVLELRSQREIVGCWLQTADVPEQLLAQLRFMLDEIEAELKALEPARHAGNGVQMREAS